MMRKRKQRDIPVTESGRLFLHCQLCIAEVKAEAEKTGKASPREYARLSVAFTDIGLQVWCTRHECNVVHIDFEGRQHPANMQRELNS